MVIMILLIYISKAEKLPIRLSVRHADNLSGTADITISTTSHHKPIVTASECGDQVAFYSRLKTENSSNIPSKTTATWLNG